MGGGESPQIPLPNGNLTNILTYFILVILLCIFYDIFFKYLQNTEKV